MYEGINRDALIPDCAETLRKYVPMMKVLNGFIRDAGPTRKITTYRGSQADPTAFVKGQWYRFSMYTASSTSSEVAARFATRCIFIFEIPAYCQNAGSLEEVSAFGKEETEYLLPPYTAVVCKGTGRKEWTFFNTDTFMEETKTLEYVKFIVAEDNLQVEEKFENLAKMFVNTNYYNLMQQNKGDDEPEMMTLVECLQRAGAVLPPDLVQVVLRNAEARAHGGITKSMIAAMILATLERKDCKELPDDDGRPPYVVLGDVMEKDTLGGLFQMSPCLQSIESFFLAKKLAAADWPAGSEVWVEQRNLREDFLQLCREEGTRFIFNKSMFLVCSTQEIALAYKREGSTIFKINVPEGPCPWLQKVFPYILSGERFQLALRPYTIAVSLGPLRLETDPNISAFQLTLLANDDPAADVLSGIRVTAG